MTAPKMNAVWLSNRSLSIRNDLPTPLPISGEALIRMRLGGICSTDLEMVKGYYPFTGILGHEFVGEVVSAPGSEQWEGKRVVGEINLSCGKCTECIAGRETHCVNRKVLGIHNKNGAFADYLTLPVRNLHEVPDRLPDELAVFTEPLAAALEIQQQVHIRPTDKVFIVGAGRLGQLVAQTISLIGCDLRVLARRERQRQLLKTTQAKFVDPDHLPQNEMDIAIEATGSPDGYKIALAAVRPRGTIVMKSTYHGALKMDASKLVVDEITLIGSRCGPFDPAVQLLASGQVNPVSMIEKKYSLANGLAGFEHASGPGVYKILLYPE